MLYRFPAHHFALEIIFQGAESMADRICYRLPLTTGQGVLPLAAANTRRSHLTVVWTYPRAAKGRYKAHFYNTPELGGQTVP